jgi:hypothetical protein
MDTDRIGINGPEISWHSDWGTAADYSVPAGECYSSNGIDDAGGFSGGFGADGDWT